MAVLESVFLIHWSFCAINERTPLELAMIAPLPAILASQMRTKTPCPVLKQQ